MSNNTNDYQLLFASELFDHEYYISNYNLGLKNSSEAIKHYLTIGFKENYNPSNVFITADYLNRYDDIKKRGINPLVHYLRYGKKEERIGLKQEEYKNFRDFYNVESALKKLDERTLVLIFLENIDNSYKCIKNIINNNDNFKIKLLNYKNYSNENLTQFKKLNDVDIVNFHIADSYENIINSINKIILNSNSDVIFIKDNIITFKNFIQK